MRRRAVFVLLAAAFLLLARAGSAAAAAPDGHVYILVVDRLSVNDIDPQTTPVLARMAREGAIGLASNRTLGSGGSEAGCLTIGAGNLAMAATTGIQGANSTEYLPLRGQTAGQLFRNLTGTDPGKNECLLINIAEIAKTLQGQKVNTRIGAMGEVLAGRGIKTCVLGNGDVNGASYRNSVAIAMNASGLVPYGDVGPETTRQTNASYVNPVTDYAALRERVKAYQSKASVIVIELSDLFRLEKGDVALPEIQQKQHKSALKEIDSFLGYILDNADVSRDMVMVVAPSAALADIEAKSPMTPVVVIGPGFEQGKLTSGATRREYIVANTDIAPTVLSFFGLVDSTHTMIGRPIIAIPARGTDTLAAVKAESAATGTVNRLRYPLVKGYIVLQIVVILLTVLAILLAPRLSRAVYPAILSLAVIPLVLLPLGRFNLSSDAGYIALTLLAVIILTAAFARGFRKSPFWALVAISAVTLLTLNIDVATGSRMIQSSVLGYDPGAGARYYGIGNEYMGILIGSVILTASAIYERKRHPVVFWVIAAVFASQCYLIAGPGLGANTDGVVTAPAAFLVTLLLLREVRIRPGVLLVVALAVLIAICGIAFWDMSRPPEVQTHIGRAANQILVGGWREGGLIIARKAGMNIKLIRYTIWSRVFLVMLLALGILLYRPAGEMARIKERHPFLFGGFAGILLGALVGLLINDSGIVAAATTSIYVATPILILMLERVSEKEKVV